VERLYPIGPAARLVPCSPEWLREQCNRGAIRYVRDMNGRRLIPSDALHEFIAKRRGKPDRRPARPAAEATSD